MCANERIYAILHVSLCSMLMVPCCVCVHRSPERSFYALGHFPSFMPVPFKPESGSQGNKKEKATGSRPQDRQDMGVPQGKNEETNTVRDNEEEEPNTPEESEKKPEPQVQYTHSPYATFTETPSQMHPYSQTHTALGEVLNPGDVPGTQTLSKRNGEYMDQRPGPPPPAFSERQRQSAPPLTHMHELGMDGVLGVHHSCMYPSGQQHVPNWEHAAHLAENLRMFPMMHHSQIPPPHHMAPHMYPMACYTPVP